MPHYRADIDQHSTIITIGIYEAADLDAAEKLISTVVWKGAKFVRAFEVDPLEVARVKNFKSMPQQMALPGI